MDSAAGGVRRVTRASNSHEGVVLAAPVSIPYQRDTRQPASYFIGQALRGMLRVAGLEHSDCDGLMVSSFSLEPDTVASLTELYELSCNWIEQVPLGGASGVVGLRRAARAVEAGDARIVACIGGDTYQPERFAELVGRFSSLSIEGSSPYGLAGANLPFALLTQAYMDRYGVGRESFGRLCALQRRHALAYRQALWNKPLTLQDYLGARMVAEPLGLFDCVMPCAGAEGFLVMSESDARQRGLDYVRLKASGERHNGARGQAMPMRLGWEHFREALYSASGFGPESVDVLQLYDDYPVMVFLQLEELGFAAPGGATQAITEEGLSVAGRPVHLNTQGGQLSAGQAGFAGGFMGLTESIRQLSGRALGNQREGVRRALVSGFGMINYDRGLCTAAATLEAVSA